MNTCLQQRDKNLWWFVLWSLGKGSVFSTFQDKHVTLSHESHRSVVDRVWDETMQKETAKTRTERDLGPRTCLSTRVSSPLAHVPVLSSWVDIMSFLLKQCGVCYLWPCTHWMKYSQDSHHLSMTESLLVCITGPKTILNKLFGKLTQLPGLESLSSSFVGLMFCLIFPSS